MAGVAVNIVLEQLVDQFYVSKDHAPAAVPLKMELIHSISAKKSEDKRRRNVMWRGRWRVGARVVIMITHTYLGV